MKSQVLEELVGFYPYQIEGKVTRVSAEVIECRGLTLPIGTVGVIEGHNRKVLAEVIVSDRNFIRLAPYEKVYDLKAGDRFLVKDFKQHIAVSEKMKGRVLNCFGIPIDGKGSFPIDAYYPLYKGTCNSLERKIITEPFYTGIRTLDVFLTTGKGQRMGIFSGSGVGKSILLGMIAKFSQAPINVIALIGERSREVNEFLEYDLTKEGLEKSVVVVATSDEPAIFRLKAIFTATTIAEYFRDMGFDVLLLVDSITRVAYAQREVGLAAGEPPVTKGYPPSVFSLFPSFMERAGNYVNGSITAFYSVLVEADDISEPVADIARSILDGHIWLSREIANRGIYPAIDILQSISRLMIKIVSNEHLSLATKFKECWEAYFTMKDAVELGLYTKKANKKIDFVLDNMDEIRNFFIQLPNQKADVVQSLGILRKILEKLQ
jgi:flagellum-specific ATP synthase